MSFSHYGPTKIFKSYKVVRKDGLLITSPRFTTETLPLLMFRINCSYRNNLGIMERRNFD